MTKKTKIILSILALISIGFSLAYYFDLWPFARSKTGNEESQTKNEQAAATQSPTPNFSPPTAQDSSFAASLVKKSTSSCVILEEQYCGQGEMVYESKEPLGIGFRLPIGAKIYVPFKSKIEDKKELKIMEINKKFYSAAVLLDLSGGLGEMRNFFVALGYPKIENKNETLEKGDFLASAEKLMVDNAVGDYNLVLTFRDFDAKSGQWQTNVELLRKFFPETLTTKTLQR